MTCAPGDKIGRKAFERQARQVLRRLRSPHAYLKQQENGDYGLHTMRSRAVAIIILDAEFISAMRAHDFLAEREGNLIAAQAGMMWLRRISLKNEDVFRRQHQARIHAQPAPDGSSDNRPEKFCEINTAENPLLWLSRRRGPDGKNLVSEAQFQAGCRLQNDFILSTMRARMTVDLTAPMMSKNSGQKSSDRLLLSEKALAARARFHKVLEILGPELSEITVQICCHGRGLEQAERLMGWPKRTGKIVLGIALTKLARHYGLMR